MHSWIIGLCSIDTCTSTVNEFLSLFWNVFNFKALKVYCIITSYMQIYPMSWNWFILKIYHITQYSLHIPHLLQYLLNYFSNKYLQIFSHFGNIFVSRTSSKYETAFLILSSSNQFRAFSNYAFPANIFANKLAPNLPNNVPKKCPSLFFCFNFNCLSTTFYQ